MDSDSNPFVSVVTPVYNGEKYLVECIESVLAQTHRNWEYIIVNNCSKDKSAEIATQYQARDKRIRLVNCTEFVGVIENHNRAFRLISPLSQYCKVVAADDWLFPECLSRMVEVAEAHPSVALVGSYTINQGGVIWVGLPLEKNVFGGRDICRQHFFGGPFVMGPPSSVLYRADVVRAEESFFPGSALCADEATYYRILRDKDFGFVHQILSFERIHEGALNHEQMRLNAFLLNRVIFLVEYGKTYLEQREWKQRFEELLQEYYQYLALAVVNRFPARFWDHHKRRLAEVGLKIEAGRLAKCVSLKMIDLALNPKQTFEKVVRQKFCLRPNY
ncbi:MAG TPA: glycosyltransferase family 2 protein [Candidatus Acidoferrales bacterium]|jgi:glycosyltransferase involved in cell wall biosynthesis|nr:glycosyltransferase family 2 protein [Candidatus Acidoferrales bacterium]